MSKSEKNGALAAIACVLRGMQWKKYLVVVVVDVYASWGN